MVRVNWPTRHPRLLVLILLGALAVGVGIGVGGTGSPLGVRLLFGGAVVFLFGASGYVAMEFQRRFDTGSAGGR